MNDAVARGGVASASSPLETAEALLVALRSGGDPEPHLESLNGYDATALEPVRTEQEPALAFWSNLYNAGTQLLLARRPELYESSLRTIRFFRATALRVAGTPLSLDDIEHGILRGSRSKYGLGYLPRLASGRFVRRYALQNPDPRIHFALNCGAASCPAIRAYERERVDEQLDLATEVYLESTADYDSEANLVELPRLFLWYRGDFGGSSGIRSLLREYGIIPQEASPRIHTRSWDWTRKAGKFADN